jgi:hypothetical protein
MRRDISRSSISRPGVLILTLALFAGSLLRYSVRAGSSAGHDFTFIVFDTSGYAATD